MKEGEKHVAKVRLERTTSGILVGSIPRLSHHTLWAEFAEGVLGTYESTPEGYHLQVTTELVKDREPAWPILHCSPQSSWPFRCSRCLEPLLYSKDRYRACPHCSVPLSGTEEWDLDHFKQEPTE